MPTNAEQLQAAYRLIRDGRLTDAQQLLLPVVRNDAGNADAWWLLANSYGDTPQALYALQQVLSLRSDDERARRMSDRLRASGISPESPFTTTFSSSASSPVQSAPAQDTFSSPFGSSSGSAPIGGFGSPDPFSPMQPEKPKNDFSSFTPMPVPQPAVYMPPQRRGGSPCLVFFAFIGFLTVIACGICSLITITGAGSIGQALQGVVGTLQANPDFARAIQGLQTQGVNFNINGTPFSSSGSFGSNLPNTLPASAVRQSEMTYNSSQNGTLPTSGLYTYTFNGTAGDRVTIAVNQTPSSSFDPVVGLYNADNQKIAEDDDGGTGVNSLISNFTLPTTGKYTILVSGFASTGGAYVVTLSH